MPVRNLLPLTIAALLGFFLGLLEALEQMTDAATLHLAELGLAIALIVALGSTFRVRAGVLPRVGVSLLRAGLSGCVFLFVFEGMRLFLKIGDVGVALASWVGAGVLALLLARLEPAGPPSPGHHGGTAPSPTDHVPQLGPVSHSDDRSVAGARRGGALSLGIRATRNGGANVRRSAG